MVAGLTCIPSPRDSFFQGDTALTVVLLQELPKSESSTWSSLAGLEQLRSLTGAYALVACAEAAATAAQGVDGAAAGLEGLGLQPQVSRTDVALGYIPQAHPQPTQHEPGCSPDVGN